RALRYCRASLRMKANPCAIDGLRHPHASASVPQTSDLMKALIFDLDGTLVDTVYAHVLAWQLAFAEASIPIDGWRLHRRMGMSGGSVKRAGRRERGRTNANQRLQMPDRRHGKPYHRCLDQRRALRGAGGMP